MTVLLIVRWPIGGIRTFISYIYSKWPDKDVELHILTPNIDQKNVLMKQLQHLNVTWHSTESENPSLLQFSRKIREVTSNNNFHLVHAHGFTSALSFSFRIFLPNCPSVFTSHDVLNDSQLTGIKGLTKSALLSMALNRFDVIQSVSYEAQENLLSKLPLARKSKCKVIVNGVDTDRFFHSDRTDLKKELGLNPDSIIIGFFGRFMSQKGFRFLINATETLNKNFPGVYHVVCFGSGAFIREEKSEILSRNLGTLFHFYDFVPDIAPYIKGCDLVAVPSLWEACPLLPMEVLSSGTPLVASRCIGLNEVCLGTPAVMVTPGDAESLAKGILEATNKPTKVFIDYALEAKERYDIQKARVQLYDLYMRLSKHEV